VTDSHEPSAPAPAVAPAACPAGGPRATSPRAGVSRGGATNAGGGRSRGAERPAHPRVKAYLLVAGVTLALVLLAIVSTFGAP